jgi:hypothetical protein
MTNNFFNKEVFNIANSLEYQKNDNIYEDLLKINEFIGGEIKESQKLRTAYSDNIGDMIARDKLVKLQQTKMQINDYLDKNPQVSIDEMAELQKRVDFQVANDLSLVKDKFGGDSTTYKSFIKSYHLPAVTKQTEINGELSNKIKVKAIAQIEDGISQDLTNGYMGFQPEHLLSMAKQLNSVGWSHEKISNKFTDEAIGNFNAYFGEFRYSDILDDKGQISVNNIRKLFNPFFGQVVSITDDLKITSHNGLLTEQDEGKIANLIYSLVKKKDGEYNLEFHMRHGDTVNELSNYVPDSSEGFANHIIPFLTAQTTARIKYPDNKHDINTDYQTWKDYDTRLNNIKNYEFVRNQLLNNTGVYTFSDLRSGIQLGFVVDSNGSKLIIDTEAAKANINKMADEFFTSMHSDIKKGVFDVGKSKQSIRGIMEFVKAAGVEPPFLKNLTDNALNYNIRTEEDFLADLELAKIMSRDLGYYNSNDLLFNQQFAKDIVDRLAIAKLDPKYNNQVFKGIINDAIKTYNAKKEVQKYNTYAENFKAFNETIYDENKQQELLENKRTGLDDAVMRFNPFAGWNLRETLLVGGFTSGAEVAAVLATRAGYDAQTDNEFWEDNKKLYAPLKAIIANHKDESEAGTVGTLYKPAKISGKLGSFMIKELDDDKYIFVIKEEIRRSRNFVPNFNDDRVKTSIEVDGDGGAIVKVYADNEAIFRFSYDDIEEIYARYDKDTKERFLLGKETNTYNPNSPKDLFKGSE